MGRFADRHPNISVRIAAEDSLVDFAQSEVDLAIRYSHDARRDLHYEKFLTEEFSWFARRGFIKTPADLAHHTLRHD